MVEATLSDFAQAMMESRQTRESLRIAIVAPVHIQPSQNWVTALLKASEVATIIIVDDSDGKVVLPEKFEVYGYQRQRDEMGDELYALFEGFHKSSSCKNFGTWLAYRRGFDPVIVIDSDCVVPPDFVPKHLDALMRTGDGWSNPLAGTGWYSRGFPYALRGMEKWAHMGLWENELDLYGSDRAAALPGLPPRSPAQTSLTVAPYFPLSGMNVSYRRESLPYMLFLPNFEYQGFKMRRLDDIWGGYIFQKFAQTSLKSVSYGDPLVYHDTVVVPAEDAAEEVGMIKFEDEFYSMVDLAMGSGAHNWSQLKWHDADILKAISPAVDYQIEAYRES